MASPPQNSDLTFPPADVAGELHPETLTHVQVDPTSSEVAASKEKKVRFTLHDEHAIGIPIFSSFIFNCIMY